MSESLKDYDAWKLGDDYGRPGAHRNWIESLKVVECKICGSFQDLYEDEFDDAVYCSRCAQSQFSDDDFRGF